MTPPEIGTMAISTSFKAGTPAWELGDECLREWLIAKRFSTRIYKIIQIVRALWLAIKPFYMSVYKHGFCSSFISYFIKEM